MFTFFNCARYRGIVLSRPYVPRASPTEWKDALAVPILPDGRVGHHPPLLRQPPFLSLECPIGKQRERRPFLRSDVAGRYLLPFSSQCSCTSCSTVSQKVFGSSSKATWPRLSSSTTTGTVFVAAPDAAVATRTFSRKEKTLDLGTTLSFSPSTISTFVLGRPRTACIKTTSSSKGSCSGRTCAPQKLRIPRSQPVPTDGQEYRRISPVSSSDCGSPQAAARPFLQVPSAPMARRNPYLATGLRQAPSAALKDDAALVTNPAATVEGGGLGAGGRINPRAGDDRIISLGVSGGSCVASRRVARDPMEWPRRQTASGARLSLSLFLVLLFSEILLARIAKAILEDCLELNHRLSLGRSVKPKPTASCPRATLAPMLRASSGSTGSHEREEAPNPCWQ
mmetsp:Transcript_19356/g.39759  ORF Transcript_19356/g.39759 Transcript_19356/m.39759 type:complete len:396 (-) Transcript_19356:1968-3155(-)